MYIYVIYTNVHIMCVQIYTITSKKALSLGAIEHIILSQFPKVNSDGIFPGLGKTLY